MLAELVERQRQEAFRRLLQRAVEYLVDLVPDRHRGNADADEPKGADKHDERGDQPAGHRPAFHALGLQTVAKAANGADRVRA